MSVSLVSTGALSPASSTTNGLLFLFFLRILRVIESSDVQQGGHPVHMKEFLQRGRSFSQASQAICPAPRGEELLRQKRDPKQDVCPAKGSKSTETEPPPSETAHEQLDLTLIDSLATYLFTSEQLLQRDKSSGEYTELKKRQKQAYARVKTLQRERSHIENLNKARQRGKKGGRWGSKGSKKSSPRHPQDRVVLHNVYATR